MPCLFHDVNKKPLPGAVTQGFVYVGQREPMFELIKLLIINYTNTYDFSYMYSFSKVSFLSAVLEPVESQFDLDAVVPH